MYSYTVFMKVLMLSLLALVGYVCIKTKYIKKQTADDFAKIITRIVVPALIASVLLSSSMTVDKIKGSIWLYIVSIAYVLFMFGLSFIISKAAKTPKEEFPVLYFLMTFTNVIFMGLPVCIALFGIECAFYVTVVATAQDTVLWTFGLIVLARYSPKNAKTKIKINPITVAFILSLIIKLIGIPIPPIIEEPLKNIGGATSYLAMIYLGMILSGAGLLSVIKKWRTYLYLFVKLIVYPLLAGLIAYKLLGGLFNLTQSGVFMVEFATGSAVALSPVFKEYDINPELASGLTFIGTIMCLFTIPFVVWLSHIIYI